MKTRILVTAALFALLVGGSMGYVAAQHNPQGEFNGPDGRLSVLKLLPVVGIWALFAFLVSAAVLWAVMMVLRTDR